MVQPGETLAASTMETYCGGKGLNQSIALARAGAEVYHAGLIGEEGEILRKAVADSGADTSCIETIAGKSGHTIIQVDQNGQNCILLYGGANRSVTREFVDRVISKFERGDILLPVSYTHLDVYKRQQFKRVWTSGDDFAGSI